MKKTIGIVGGTTPESTSLYYLHITRSYQERFGDYDFPPVVIYSVRFKPYMDWMAADRWDLVCESLLEVLSALKRAGCDFALLSANTLHRVFPELAPRSPLPLLNIIDCVGRAISGSGIRKIALLGTRTTMSEPFYKDGLSVFGIEAMVPDEESQRAIHGIIVNELGKAVVKPESKEKILGITQTMADRGAQAVVLACTELPLLIQPPDTRLPLFDTARIHAGEALAMALA